ncbi:MAG: asparagine synthase [Clostridiales bacterium]|nr:asparagine synthase [Clostridiales bacterium]MCF8022257.1 asparagine synthase [Clostridiales bacterium]
MRNGSLMTVLGTIESGTGMAMRERKPLVGWGLTGLGMASVMYGLMDMYKGPHER